MDGETVGTGVREDAIGTVLESAARLGVEIDEREAAEWVAQMGAETAGGDLVVDVDSGVYGHRVTMLDFTPADLQRFRRMANVVGFQDRPPQVETALSLSGSAAQSKINRFPADCDFFERVHIRVATREEACAILGDLMREKALATASGPGFRLSEVKFGTHDEDVTKGGKPVRRGSPMSWSLQEVQAGAMAVIAADGTERALTWEDAERQPGWCKLDWVIADRERGRLANASNMLDVTWEAPDGRIVPLDGFLDPYFQEVYLEAESVPLFQRLVKQLSADSVDEYAEQLEHEVRKYTVEDPNWGKAARRLYNIFRLQGRYREAAYLRELFDEPITALYQVAALLRTLDDAAESGDVFDAETMVSQVDGLIMSAIQALDGPQESQMVANLLRVRDSLSEREARAEREDELSGVREAALTTVNDYFHRALTAMPSIAEYLEELAARPG
jgi:hypothetical protein